jgi:hypothetical protein
MEGAMKTRSLLKLGWMVLGVVLVAGCSGGDSGPTGPSGPSGPVTLFGIWQGSMTATRGDTGAQMTCSLTLDLEDDEDPQGEIFFGSWLVTCPDGSGGGGPMSAFLVLRQVVLVSLQLNDQEETFSGCSWSGDAQLGNGRLTGSWRSTDDCPVSWSGSLDLTL